MKFQYKQPVGVVAIHRFSQILFLTVLVAGCGSPFSPTAGTGQQGEAKIIGIAMTSTGTVAAHQSLTVASADFVNQKTDINARGAGEKQKIVTDANGEFSITVEPGQKVTISGRRGNDFIYIPELSSGTGAKNLGNVSFEPGKELKIYPWWIRDDQLDRFTIKGTDLGYIVPDSAVTTIWVPRNTINLVHYDKNGSVTIPFNGKDGQGTLGDSTKWDSTKVILLDSVDVPVKGIVNDSVRIRYSLKKSDGTHVLFINWGDSTPVMKMHPDFQYEFHRHTLPGTYTIVFDVKKLNIKTGLFESVQKEKKVITIYPSGKEGTTTNDSTIQKDTTVFQKRVHN